MLAIQDPSLGEAAVSLAQLFERFTETSNKLELKYAGLLREVEELRAQLSKKEEEVKRSERLAMLGETAAALAHEVRNPLGAITLFLSMLKSDVSDRPQALQMVDEIERSISSLNNVVSNVLHFAKDNHVRPVPINIHSILNETAQHFSSLYAPAASVVVTTSGNPFVVADDQALRQALYNLMVNALQASRFEGTITIDARDWADGDGTVVTISDSGPGITDSVMQNLFDPFVSGKASGTGLGLSIVRRIIEAHSGTISARNESGAVFTIQLPRKVASQVSRAA